MVATDASGTNEFVEGKTASDADHLYMSSWQRGADNSEHNAVLLSAECLAEMGSQYESVSTFRKCMTSTTTTSQTALQSTILQTIASHISHSADQEIEQHILARDVDQDSFENFKMWTLLVMSVPGSRKILSCQIGSWTMVQTCM